MHYKNCNSNSCWYTTTVRAISQSIKSAKPALCQKFNIPLNFARIAIAILVGVPLLYEQFSMCHYCTSSFLSSLTVFFTDILSGFRQVFLGPCTGLFAARPKQCAGFIFIRQTPAKIADISFIQSCKPAAGGTCTDCTISTCCCHTKFRDNHGNPLFSRKI